MGLAGQARGYADWSIAGIVVSRRMDLASAAIFALSATGVIWLTVNWRAQVASPCPFETTSCVGRRCMECRNEAAW